MSFQDDYCLVALGKDPMLIGSLTRFVDEPRIIVTTNGVTYGDLRRSSQEIAFNHFAGRSRNFPFSDGGLQGLVATPDFEFPLEGGDIKDLKWTDALFKFREEIDRRLREESSGRSIAVNTYSNSVHSDRLRKMGFLVLGPKFELVNHFSNKIKSYNLAKKLEIPVVDGDVVDSLEDARDLFEEYNWENGAFVTSEKGSGGKTAKHICSLRDLDIFEGAPPLLMTEWIRKEQAPNSLVLIGKDRCLYLGVTDQIIVRGVEYFGNTFPSRATERAQNKIRDYTLKFAEYMRKKDYRGFSGFDWMTSGDDVFFSEINPRKNRSTSMLVASLEKNRPSGVPSISEMEVLATLEKPFGYIDSWDVEEGIHWGMRLFKTFGQAEVIRGIRPEFDDTSIFRGDLKNPRSSVLNFPKKGVVLERFTNYHDLARIISLGNSHEEVNGRIEDEREKIRKSYRKF